MVQVVFTWARMAKSVLLPASFARGAGVAARQASLALLVVAVLALLVAAVRRSLEQCVVRHYPGVALVSAELWEAANRELAARGNRQVGARARRQAYALSGLVRCGDCGALMSGVPQRNKASRVRLYTCSSHFRYHRCHRNSVCEDRLLPVLRDVMLERLFCGGDMERLRAAILKKLEARANDGREQRLKGELTKAKADMARAARNLLLADPANVPFLNKA